MHTASEQKTFYRNETREIGRKIISHSHWIPIFFMLQKRSFFLMTWMFVFFTRVENKQKKQNIFDAPQRLHIVSKQICLRPVRRLPGVNIGQVKRVCASQERPLHRCNRRFRFFLVHTRPQLWEFSARVNSLGFHSPHHCQCNNISVASPFSFPPSAVSWCCYVTH